MAHFAQLDDSNVVTQVIVVHNNELMVDGVESEEKGIEFCQSLLGPNTYWKQTSYNASFRKNYAGIGFTYDFQRDAFIAPQPYPSWILDEQTCLWKPPIPYPNDGKPYYWDEAQQNWIEGVPNV
jgi:hypothetical protein